jgi:tRNA dimethylallyltransferase
LDGPSRRPAVRVLAIVGPTASGKSALALELAARLPADVVSCDSLMVYQGMDIGTGKPTAAERRRVPHHLLDVAPPTEAFHAARWAALARAAIHDIVAEGRVPLVVGGTGLYLRALLRGLFQAPPPDEAIRARQRDEAARFGVESLHARLALVDPETAGRVQPRDLMRVGRALEVFEQTGIPISVLRREATRPDDIRAATLVLDPPLDELRARITPRFDLMMEAGLLEETRRLRAACGAAARPLQALGYKQMGAHLEGRLTLDEAMASAKVATVAYARRQRTFFRKEPTAWRSPERPSAEAVHAWWRAQEGEGERS